MTNRQTNSEADQFGEWLDDNRGYLSASDELAFRFIEYFVVPRLEDNVVAICHDIYDSHRVADHTWATHYTSVSTLVQMIDSHLRLYDTFHLNDPHEGKGFVKPLQDKHTWLGDAQSHAYVASFVQSDDGTDRSDKLTFWQSYGSDGIGCSVTLKTVPIPLYRVRYGKEPIQKAHRRIEPVIDALEPVLHFLDNDGQEAERLRLKLAKTIWRGIGGIPYLYKADAYREEHECRIVIAEHTLRNEDKRNIVIGPYPKEPDGDWRHYYEHAALAADKIFNSDCTIVLGPSVRNRNNAAYCLERLLIDREGSGVRVRGSKIPYRGSVRQE